jgi:hypothetical protein
MGTWERIGLVLGLLITLVPGVARAQYIPPSAGAVPAGRPGYSPYLNLTRPGNPATNYFGLVRPEIEARVAAQSLQVQVNQIRQQQTVQPGTPLQLPPTGYQARFLDYARYFPGGAPGQVRPTGSTSAVTPAATPARPVPLATSRR